MSSILKFVTSVLVTLLVFAPQVALACPACATRENGGVAAQVLMVSMMLLPFAVAGAAIFVVKRYIADEEQENVPPKGEPKS